MITVGVRNQDLSHPLACERAFQGLDMCRNIGSGINQSHIALADNVNAGPFESERTGIGRKHPGDARRHRQAFAVGRIETAVEGDWRGHWSMLSVLICRIAGGRRL